MQMFSFISRKYLEVKLAWPLQKGSNMKEKEHFVGWKNKEVKVKWQRVCHALSSSGWELVLPGEFHFGRVSSCLGVDLRREGLEKDHCGQHGGGRQQPATE